MQQPALQPAGPIPPPDMMPEPGEMEPESERHGGGGGGGGGDDGELAKKGIEIRGLPMRSSDTSIRDGLFHMYKKYGKAMVNVFGQGPERYAIISFKREDDARKALAESQGRIFFGSEIITTLHDGMEIAEDPSEEEKQDEYCAKATRALFVGNLQKDVSIQLIKTTFEVYGDIINIEMKTPSSTSAYAFVQYEDISSVVKAIREMEGKSIGDKPIKLGFGKCTPTTCVWVNNLPEQLEIKALEVTFSRYGPVLHVLIDRLKTRGLVYYETVHLAETAVNEMRGHLIGGNKIQIDFASRDFQTVFLAHMEVTEQLKPEDRPDERLLRESSAAGIRDEESFTERSTFRGGGRGGFSRGRGGGGPPGGPSGYTPGGPPARGGRGGGPPSGNYRGGDRGRSRGGYDGGSQYGGYEGSSRGDREEFDNGYKSSKHEPPAPAAPDPFSEPAKFDTNRFCGYEEYVPGCGGFSFKRGPQGIERYIERPISPKRFHSPSPPRYREARKPRYEARYESPPPRAEAGGERDRYAEELQSYKMAKLRERERDPRYREPSPPPAERYRPISPPAKLRYRSISPEPELRGRYRPPSPTLSRSKYLDRPPSPGGPPPSRSRAKYRISESPPLSRSKYLADSPPPPSRSKYLAASPPPRSKYLADSPPPTRSKYAESPDAFLPKRYAEERTRAPRAFSPASDHSRSPVRRSSKYRGSPPAAYAPARSPPPGSYEAELAAFGYRQEKRRKVYE